MVYTVGDTRKGANARHYDSTDKHSYLLPENAQRYCISTKILYAFEDAGSANKLERESDHLFKSCSYPLPD